MKCEDLDRIEQELKRFPPARPSEAFLARLVGTEPKEGITPETPGQRSRWLLARLFRWGLPLTGGAVALVLLFVVGGKPHPGDALVPPRPVSASDSVQLDRELMATYEAVADFPDAMPVRFRFYDWRERLTVEDPERGVTVERSAARLEVVPVRYEIE